MTVDEATLKDEIREIKRKFGSKLVILGHFYQRREILDFADYMGDSFELSRKAAQLSDAKHIIFCGVHFMAESAAILVSQNQTVQIPALDAGCPMADMASIEDVERAWHEITRIISEKKIIPIAYMNSSADIKAFCGRHGGAVCTSSNAEKLFRWGLNRAEKIFFLPDEHLGRNTANILGIPQDERILWDAHHPEKSNEMALSKATLILWNGFCHVHTFFIPEHIKNIRKRFPGAVIIAHPECREEVMELVDFSGSTAFIENYVRKAPSGAVIAIATEINMVDRLAREFPDKTIVEVARSLCPNMFKNNLFNLKQTLDNLGQKNVVTVPAEIKEYASRALRTMIEVTTKTL